MACWYCKPSRWSAVWRHCTAACCMLPLNWPLSPQHCHIGNTACMINRATSSSSWLLFGTSINRSAFRVLAQADHLWYWHIVHYNRITIIETEDLRNEDKCEKECCSHHQSQTKQSSVCLMVGIQSKLNNCQQSQSDAVNVDDDSYLLGVIQSFDLDSANVEGHEHGHQLEKALVGIWDSQPYNSAKIDTRVYELMNILVFSLYNAKIWTVIVYYTFYILTVRTFGCCLSLISVALIREEGRIVPIVSIKRFPATTTITITNKIQSFIT